MTKDFNDFFSQVIPTLNQLEEIRIKGYGKSRKRLTVIWVCLILSIFISIIIPEPFLMLIMTSINLVLIGRWIQIIKTTLSKLRPTFKKEIIQPLLDYFYDDVTYIPRQRISIKLLQNSLLFNKTVSRHTGEDYTQCKIGETFVHFSEVQAYNGNNKSFFFNGVFIVVQFNKSFNSKTVVLPEKKTTILRKNIMNLRGDMSNANIIKLEDPVFQKEFVVIGEDQVESRYKLSTSLMQRLLNYKNKVNKQISFSFIDNRLYVTIPEKVNLFEPRISKPINSQEFIKSNYEYFELLTGIVNDLDLNTKIWI